VKAIGNNMVKAVTMPERDITTPKDITDVMHLCHMYDVTCDTVEITPILHVIRDFLPLHDVDSKISYGNLKARIRMMIAYHYANNLNYMVIGSSNKTELLMGYFTKYGDGGVDLMPLADLYKTQIRQLAKYLDLPKSIITKAPSAGLWVGQTDEGELGIDYDTLDLILYGHKLGVNNEEIASHLGIENTLVNRIIERIETTVHKRKLPLILRLS
jgi:NAD+ synthase